MVTKVVLSLHDQATELRYPERLQAIIALLFGERARSSGRPPGQSISIKRPVRIAIAQGQLQAPARRPERARAAWMPCWTRWSIP